MTQQRTFHGEITPDEVAAALVAEFNRGNYRAQQVSSGDKVMVQIATREGRQSGGNTALAAAIQKGRGRRHRCARRTGFARHSGQPSADRPRRAIPAVFPDRAARRPGTGLLSSLTLTDQVWAAIEKYAKAAGAAKEISERLRTVACPNCGTANKVGEPKCVACSAPLGDIQPHACQNCGHVMEAVAKFCSNCGAPMKATSRRRKAAS